MAGTNIPELYSGQSWSTATITYSFITGWPSYLTATLQTQLNPLLPFNDAEKNVAIELFSYVSTFTNLSFQEDNNQIGDITLARATLDLNLKGRTLDYPGPEVGGDVYISSNLVMSLFRGTLLHEIGHALGLKHPHQGNPTFDLNEDNLSYSIMSERLGDPNIPYPRTFMIYDIAELQHLYGARENNTGNEVYSYGETRVRETIWDTGGVDTLSAALSQRGALLNLNEGTFSSIIDLPDYGPDNPANNIGIALGVTIEKAIGSESADIVIGNSVSNTVNAGGGDDSIFGDEVVARNIIRSEGGSFAYRDWYFDDKFWFRGKYQSFGTTNEDDDDVIFGEAGKDDIYGGDGDDALHGGTEDDDLTGNAGSDYIDGGAGFDTAYYDAAHGDSGAVPEIKILGSDEPTGNVPPGTAGPFYTATRGAEVDVLHSIESVKLGDGSTKVLFENGRWKAAFLEIDGGSAPVPGTEDATLADVLDFSTSPDPIHVGSAVTQYPNSSTSSHAVEAYQAWDPITQTGQWIWNAFVPSANAATGAGFTEASGLRFTNFEHVIGSSGDDRLALWWLNPGGELTAEQEEALQAAKSTPVTLGDPATVGAALDARMEAARLIPQNQQEVVIEGGAGKDMILGTRTGVNEIYGGAGIDHLYAGGFTSIVDGGADTDYVEGGGFKSQLYGGSGADIFGLANHAFAMDATAEDFVTWGAFHLTGGVQQWWMEGGWAYWSPFTSLISSAPLPFLNVFGAIGVILDAPTMGTVRYALAGDQLVVQFARGRGGQAVIENYDLDFDTGKATGNIVAFQQVLVDPGSATIDDFKTYVRLALKAGFGTDPLVLDLDGDGLELTRLDDVRVYFNVDGDDFAERTAWVKSDDGLLARDVDGNGTIDGIGELFGNATTTGFAALAALDSNADGKISAADTEFGSLRVWRDLDGDGVTDAGELETLAASGISEISLTTGTPATGSINGNTITAEATFTRSDGTTSKISDVVLDGNQTDSRYLGDATVSAAAGALPNLKGYGNVTSLAVAMTNDATLLDQVSAFKNLAADTTWTALKNAVDDIMFRWAGVDGMTATSMGGGTFDTRKLAFLEEYFGYALTPRDGNGVPSEANLAELIASWNDVLDKITIRLAVQGPLHELFDDRPYDVVTDRFFSPGSTTLADAYEAAIVQLSATPAEAQTEWSTHWGPMLAAFTEALVRHDQMEIRTDFAVQSLVRALDGLTPAMTLEQLVSGLGLPGVTIGTDGNDTLVRGSGSDLQVYLAGAGNDTITGGGGQDVYVFGRDFGQDTIIDSEGLDRGDRIRLALYNADDVTMSREGIDLVIRINGTADKITVEDQFATPLVNLAGVPVSPDRGIEEIQFADGTIYEDGEIAAAVGLGTNGNDIIEGSGVADELEGLLGDDLLKGGDAGDTYYFTRGDGHDTIEEVITNPAIRGADTLLLLGGITAADLQLSREGRSDDLHIGFTWSGDSITVKDQFAYTALGFQTSISPDNRIEAIFFDMGTAWSWIDVQANLIAKYTTAGDDVTYGFGTSDQLFRRIHRRARTRRRRRLQRQKPGRKATARIEQLELGLSKMGKVRRNSRISR